MPIYDYRCAACDHELEAIQKISDDKLVDCPACAKPELKKATFRRGLSPQWKRLV